MSVSLSRRHVLAGLAAAGLVPSAQGGRPPNVLWISIDDLNDWTGVLGGHPQASTPHLDALAARGRSFSQAHCNAPACNPSRTATLTGVAPHRSGVYSNQAAWWEPLGDVPTLPTLLRSVGYRTLGAGKIFHFGARDVWDAYMGDPCDKLHTATSGHPSKSKGRRVDGMGWGPARSKRDKGHPDRKIADWVSAQLAAPQREPFFLAAGFMKPHLPWWAPKAFYDAHPLKDVVLPHVPLDEMSDIPAAGQRLAYMQTHAKIVKSDAWQSAVQGYLAATSFVDSMLGELIAAFDASPHKDNTLVVLWSDHGWSLGEKFHWKKFALWEECTRVPLVFMGPGITPGSCDKVVSLLDIYPTLASICGAPVPHMIDGIDLSPLLADPATPWHRPVLTTQGGSNHAIRTQRWRYIRYSDGGEELYDHTKDPGEHRNLVGKPGAEPVLAQLRPLIPRVSAPAAPEASRKCRPD